MIIILEQKDRKRGVALPAPGWIAVNEPVAARADCIIVEDAPGKFKTIKDRRGKPGLRTSQALNMLRKRLNLRHV